jgi:hypothetical protein
MHLTDNQTKVRDALPTDGTATPADVAEATGLAYSTVTRLLRELAEIGAAVKEPEGWRHTNAATDTEATDEATATSTAAAAAAPTVDTADTVDATDADHADPAEPGPVGPVGTDEPDATDAEEDHGEPDDVDDVESDDLTDHAGEASDPTAEAEPAKDTTPVKALDDGDVDDTAGEATVTVTGDGEATEQEDGAGDPSAPRQPRMGKGQLRDRVLDALRAATEPLGPTQLSKVLDGKSQGAISNACDRLVARGEAVLVTEAPRRFEATRTS